jgi:dipeptidyl aminopeptidase/acylaminoacyl peptidase
MAELWQSDCQDVSFEVDAHRPQAYRLIAPKSWSKTMQTRKTARKLVIAVAMAVLLASPAAAQATARGLNGRIAFDNDSIWIMNPDGSLKMDIGQNLGLGQSDPACSPTGRYVAFITIIGTSNGAVAVVDSTGQNPRFVSGQQHAASGPAWSPDESKIAYSQFLAPPASTIMVADADGVNQGTPITGVWDPNTGSYPDRNNIQPEWSPDGTQIAFASDRDGDYDIYTITLATGVIKQLTNDPGADMDPTWAPGGGRIAFTRESAGVSDIWVMRSDGFGPVNVTSASAASESQPNWSPDGKKIVYMKGIWPQVQVFKMNTDGSARTLLANRGQTPSWCGLVPLG